MGEGSQKVETSSYKSWRCNVCMVIIVSNTVLYIGKLLRVDLSVLTTRKKIILMCDSVS